MAKTREISKRIKAVGNIKRITRTMQLIATAKFSQAQGRALSSKPFTEGVFDLVRQLAATAGDLDHPLVSGPAATSEDARELTLILTSDRGLCGPYNGQVLRTATRYLRQTPSAMEGPIELVGKKGVAFLKFNRILVGEHYTQFGDKPANEEMDRLAQRYMDRFMSGEVSAVRVIFMRFITTARQRPEVLQLLPLRPPEGEEAEAAEGSEASGTGHRAVFEFSPSESELLDELIPAAVKATLRQCFLDAIVSEHVARMIAMKAATDNAGKMGKLLKRQFNRARQAQITTELTEIVSGAAALE